MPVSVEAVSKLIPQNESQYKRKRFEPRQVTHKVLNDVAVDNNLQLRIAEADTSQNLHVRCDDEKTNVAFLGSMASFGVVPLGFTANFDKWISTIEELLNEDINMYVPGHGNPGGRTELSEFCQYLKACKNANGDINNLSLGPWQEWANPEFHEINVERAHMNKNPELQEQIPNSMKRLLEN